MGFWWHFDRIFGDNRRVGWQLAIIVVLVLLLVSVIGLVGWFLQSRMQMPKGDDHSTWVQAVGLAFGASDLPTGDNESQAFPLWWQAIAMLLGSVLFSGVTITFVSNLLGNRQEAYRNGSARYRFRNHVLLLGGGEMALSVLQRERFAGYHVVVATQDDVQAERLRVESLLGRKECRNVTVLHAYRDNKCDLESLRLEQAKLVYIVGEQPDEERYDQLNAACWKAASEICNKAENTREVPCVLFLEHEETAHIFYSSNQLHGNLDTLVMSRLESASQIMFNNCKGLPLDRGGIGPDSERTVHLVIYGMTPFARAVATTAAHLCHFPNFVSVEEKDGKKFYGERPDRRTRITFIAPDMEQERDAFMASMSGLFGLSKVTVDGEVRQPEEDFLDIEWEFVGGSITEPRIQTLLEEYYAANQEGHTYLTLALCETPAGVFDNYRMATHSLPSCYRTVVSGGDGKPDYSRTVPVFIYQPEGEELVRMATARPNGNIITAGSVQDNYNDELLRRMREGMMVNYVYSTAIGLNDSMTDAEVKSAWEQMRRMAHHSDLLSLSNIYCANHIRVKLRSIGDNGERLHSDEALTDLMSVVEHNRWNMEKLLMGYSPVPRAERERLKQLEQDGKEDECRALKKQLKSRRAGAFCHECIAPYEQLLDADKQYDRVIVKHLPEIIENKNPNIL